MTSVTFGSAGQGELCADLQDQSSLPEKLVPRLSAIRIERFAAAGRGAVDAANVGPVPASTKCRATRQSCAASSRRHQQAIALVATHRCEKVTISGAPGRNTRPTSRMSSAGRVKCWIAPQIAAPSNSLSPNGSTGSD